MGYSHTVRQLANHDMILLIMRTLLSALLVLVRAALMSRATLALENAALRQQLTICLRVQKRTRLRAEDRLFWVALHRLWSDCTRSLVIVKPATVLGWPRIPRTHIHFVKRISGGRPEWGEDKIAEELAAKFGI